MKKPFTKYEIEKLIKNFFVALSERNYVVPENVKLDYFFYGTTTSTNRATNLDDKAHGFCFIMFSPDIKDIDTMKENIRNYCKAHFGAEELTIIDTT